MGRRARSCVLSAHPGNRRSIACSATTSVGPAARAAVASRRDRTAGVQISADATQKSDSSRDFVRAAEAKIEVVQGDRHPGRGPEDDQGFFFGLLFRRRAAGRYRDMAGDAIPELWI